MKKLEDTKVSEPLENQTLPPEPLSEASGEVGRGSGEVREDEPLRSSREIAERYGVSDRTFQEWFKVVCQAYFWVPLSDLKVGVSSKTRYTSLTQRLISEYRAAADTLSVEDWIKKVHAENGKVEAFDEPIEAEPIEAEPFAVQVLVGNHQTVLPSPEMPNALSLEVLRTSEMISLDDPLALAAKFVEAANLVTTAMEQDLLKRREQLRQTEAVRNLSLEQRLYRQEADRVNDQVSSASKKLHKSLTSIEVLRTEGKPPDGEEEQPG